MYPSLPDYSPTGKKIIYTSCEDTLGKDSGISTINVGGGGKFEVTHVTHNNTDDEEPSYSPDGKKIVYTSWDGHDTEIYTIDVDGKNRVRLTDNATYDYYPSYSPDGRRIAYSQGGDRNSAIYTINVGGGGESKVTEGGYPSWGSEASP